MHCHKAAIRVGVDKESRAGDGSATVVSYFNIIPTPFPPYVLCNCVGCRCVIHFITQERSEKKCRQVFAQKPETLYGALQCVMCIGRVCATGKLKTQHKRGGKDNSNISFNNLCILYVISKATQ